MSNLIITKNTQIRVPINISVNVHTYKVIVTHYPRGLKPPCIQLSILINSYNILIEDTHDKITNYENLSNRLPFTLHSMIAPRVHNISMNSWLHYTVIQDTRLVLPYWQVWHAQFTHLPALTLELQRSPWPSGGPCVIRMSIPSGIRSHFCRHCSPRLKLNAQLQNSGCLYNTHINIIEEVHLVFKGVK